MDEIIDQIEEAIGSLYGDEVKFTEQLSRLLPEIQNAYYAYIDLIPQLNAIGLDIDGNSVMGQLNRLVAAVKEYDKVEIFDLLCFDISKTLADYGQILAIMNE